MKVALLVSQIRGQGGLEKYARHTAEAFASAGCQVTVLTTGDVSPEGLGKAKCDAVARRHPLSVVNLWRFDQACQQWLRDHPADIVFSFDRNRHQTHLRAGNGVHAAYLERRAMTDSRWRQWSFKFNPLHQSLLHFERVAFQDKGLRKLFVNSEMVSREVRQHYDVSLEKISVIHNGVEWHAWQKPFDSWPTARSGREKGYTFLFVGHGYRRKGLPLLLQGLARLKSRDWTLIVIGKDREQKAMQQLAKRLHISDKVLFLGPVKEVIPYYQIADALVIPSIYDPFANVTVEALAMGLFVVSSRFNGGHEVLTETNGAVISDLLDPDSVAEALEAALRKRKTVESAEAIRQSIKGLDFSHQLRDLVAQTLAT